MIAFSWLFITTVSLTISVILLWFYVFKVENKYLSIVNLSPSDIIIKFNYQEYSMKAFDAKEFILNSKNTFKIEVLDINRKNINNITIPKLKNNQQLINLAIVDDNSSECYFSSNLTNIFKEVSSKDPIIQINPLVNDQISIIDLDLLNNIYFYPGKNITNNLISDKNIIGVYPLECKYLNDSKRIMDTINIYKNYNSESQRKYFEDSEQKILNSVNIDELR